MFIHVEETQRCALDQSEIMAQAKLACPCATTRLRGMLAVTTRALRKSSPRFTITTSQGD